VYEAPCPLADRTEAYSMAIDIADKIRRGESFAQREECSSDGVALKRKWPLRNRITTPLDPASTNKLQPVSLFGEASLYLPYHRALPRLLSVTESIALPPRPKGGRYVQYLQIQCSRVAGAPGIAADLFCAADRRRDAHSMVVRLGGPAQSAQANSSFAPTKRTRPSLARELDARAVAALDEARGMPSAHGGDEQGNDPAKCR
jgi:hypothetical protein